MRIKTMWKRSFKAGWANLIRVGTLGLLGLIVVDGFSLHYQLDNLKKELALAKRDIETANKNMMSLQLDVSQIRQDQSSAAVSLTRLEDRLSALPVSSVLQITAAEGKIIREFFVRLDALKPMAQVGYKVGDAVPSDQLLDFSVLLTEKLPKLKSTKYTIDQDRSIIIASETGNRVIAILSTP
jgi:hypothetical protein